MQRLSQHDLIRVLRDTRGLNHSQRIACAVAHMSLLSTIHGPPGTGKTRTAASFVRSWLRRQDCLLSELALRVGVDETASESDSHSAQERAIRAEMMARARGGYYDEHGNPTGLTPA